MAIAPRADAIQAWLDTAPNSERTGDFRGIRLERIRAFLVRLPPPPAPCTVAGTKGKGSTVRLMECALVAGGRRTLAFTSPHVSSVLERWRVDGRSAEPGAVAAACDEVERLERRHGEALTWFERTFAVACLLAAGRADTRFLCEVGLGGRLDCANALDCDTAVLTHLSHDHRDVLGPTLHHIAREKLAVSRPDRPLVIAPQTPLAALALWRAVPPFRALPTRAGGRRGVNLRPRGETVWVQRPAGTWRLGLPGAHQQDNAATAAAALARFAPDLQAGDIARGFAAATLAARCQAVEHGGRRLLIDGAHNRESIAATLAEAGRTLGAGWRLILALAGDKEIDEILPLIPAHLPVTRCAYRSPRARGRDDWPAAARPWRWCENVAEALAVQPPHADVCITGSLYLAGEALEHLGLAGVIPG